MGFAVAFSALILLLVAAASRAFPTLLVGAVIVSTSLVPIRLFGDYGVPHVGVAPATVVVTAYAAVVGVGFLTVLFKYSRVPLWRQWLPFFSCALLGVAFVWSPLGGREISGLMQYLLAPMAWTIGIAARRHLRYRSRIVQVIAVVLALQVAIVVCQRLGMSINSLSLAQQELMGNRANGTLSHPNDLGKVTVLLCCLALSVYEGSSERIKRLVVVSFVMGGVIIIATGGRAVLFGYVAMILFWLLLQRSSVVAFSKKLGVIGLLAVGGVASAGVLLERFATDPSGGSRSSLAEVAMRSISERPWFGVGPNNYVSTVGLTDSLTLSGVPVHNLFLLAAAEIGILGCVFLFLPALRGLMRAVRYRRAEGEDGAFARVGLAFLPSAMVMGLTGWGLLGGYVLPLLFFSLGWLLGDLGQGRSERTHGSDARAFTDTHARSRDLVPITGS